MRFLGSGGQRPPSPRARAIVLAFLLAFAFLPAPPALAQVPIVATSVTVDIQEPNGPPLGVMVPGRPYSLEVKVNYQYGQGALQPTGPTQIDLELFGAPSWMHAKLNATSVFVSINTTSTVGGSTASNKTTVDANLTIDAPAFEITNITVRAHARENGNLAASDGEDSQVFRPGFIPGLKVEPLRASAIARGGVTTQVPVRLVNLGNGPLRVHLTAPSFPQGLKVVLPAEVLVPSRATGDEPETTIYVTLLAPWTTTPRGDIELRADFVHAERPELAGEPETTSFGVEGSSPIPGIESVAALVGLVAVALLTRRRA